MAIYYPNPEGTAECGYCLHRANGAEFMRRDEDGKWSECPECGGSDETVPWLDEADIANDIAESKEAR